MKRKTKEIKLFGRNLLLSQRYAGDVVAFIKEASKLNSKEMTYTDIMLNAATILEDGLRINIQNLKWYNFIKKRIFPKILTNSYLLNNLLPEEILENAGYVYELDGITLDKTQSQAGQDKKKVV